jgi:hypothetical protein
VHHLLTINTHRFTLVFEEGEGGLYWHRDWHEGTYDVAQSIFLNSNEYWAPLPSYARVREEHPHGRLLDRVEPQQDDGRGLTRTGWVPLRTVCAALIALPLVWLGIWIRGRRAASGSRRKTRLGITSRLRRWALVASTGAATGVTCLWVTSACWRECNIGLGNRWDLVFPLRECVVVVIHDSTDTDPTLWANEWQLPPEKRTTANPTALGLFPKFEFEPIRSRIPFSLFTPSSAQPPPPVVGYSLTIPYWFLFLATALYPMWRGFAGLGRFMISRKRQRNGYCIGCGYDLRAASGRCPECGASCKAATRIIATTRGVGRPQRRISRQ